MDIQIILALIILVLGFCLGSPNIVYFIHKRHFQWRKKEENLALSILKEVYPHGDDYYSGENDNECWASFSNDYPLQHGTGWGLRINKKTYEFTTTGDSKSYHTEIQKLIKWKV